MQELNAQMVEQNKQDGSSDDDEVGEIANIQQVFKDLVDTLKTQSTKETLDKIIETAHSDLSPQNSLEIYITNTAHQRIDRTFTSQNISGLVSSSGPDGETYYIRVTTPSDQAQGEGSHITELSLASEEDALEIVEKQMGPGGYMPTGSFATIYPHEIVGIKIVPIQR